MPLKCFNQTGAPGVDSPPLRHWQESVLVSAEDPSSSRMARVSPSHQRNGHDDRAGSVSRMEEARGSTRQTHPEHLSTGPAPLAAQGSSSSMSYIGYSDIDSEYNMDRDQAQRMNYSYREQVLSYESGSGSINRALLAQEEHFSGRRRSSSKRLLNMSHEFDEPPQVDQIPACSAPVDLSSYTRERHRSSPLTVTHIGSRSASPATDSFHHPSAPSYAEQNGGGSAPLHFEEGRFSSIACRSPRLQKPPRLRHQPNTNPNQAASSPGQEPCPVLSRAERMAALERRMVANGLSAPGRSRTSPGQKRKRQAGVAHVAAVQMSDYCTTSGSESSESEVETNRGTCSSPLMSGPPAESNSTSPLPRNKFSFGSLQLDEEPDEDGCHAFSDEDGAQIFSC